MSRKYRELVAIRVVFSKVSTHYKMVHFYRVVTIAEKSGPLAMEGYEMERASPSKDIETALRSAYKPVVLSAWKQEEVASASKLLQFQPGATPEELGLHGEWSVWTDE